MGRPTKFTQELAADICARLANGETLSAMCREEERFPDRSTVARWIVENVKFRDEVAHAREAGSHILIDETREIADDGVNDYMERHHGESTSWVVNGECVQRSKLRIEQRWREAEAILPKVYGKRQMIEHSGSIDINTTSDDELIAELLHMAATGRLKLPGVELVELDEVVTEPPIEDDDPW